MAATIFWAAWGATILAFGRSYWRSRNRVTAIVLLGCGALAIVAALVL